MRNRNLCRRLAGKIAAVAGACAMIAGAAHAQNSFTEAGTNVQNTFTLDYEISSTPQPTITNDPSTTIPGAVVQGSETEFTVDRLIDLQLTQQNSPLTVAPGTSTARLEYLLVNEGNDAQAYSFSIADVAGDDFDDTSYVVEYFIDTNANSDPFDDAAVTITVTPTGTGTTTNVTPDVLPDQTIGVRITSAIPSSATDGELDDLILVAQTRDPVNWQQEGATGSGGTTTAADPDTNSDTGVAENVLADGSGTSEEVANDGLHSDTGRYIVSSPDLTAVKSVDIIATTPTDCATDSAGGATEYSVPGSCVEYVITVDNNGATATADAIDIADVLPEEVNFVTASFSGWDASPVPTLTTPSGAAATCDGTASTCNVTLTGASLSAGGQGTLTIRALVK